MFFCFNYSYYFILSVIKQKESGKLLPPLNSITSHRITEFWNNKKKNNTFFLNLAVTLWSQARHKNKNETFLVWNLKSKPNRSKPLKQFFEIVERKKKKAPGRTKTWWTCIVWHEKNNQNNRDKISIDMEKIRANVWQMAKSEFDMAKRVLNFINIRLLFSIHSFIHSQNEIDLIVFFYLLPKFYKPDRYGLGGYAKRETYTRCNNNQKFSLDATKHNC